MWHSTLLDTDSYFVLITFPPPIPYKSNTTTVQPTTCLGILVCYVFFDLERYAGTLFDNLRDNSSQNLVDRKLGGPRAGLTLWQENTTTVLQLCKCTNSRHKLKYYNNCQKNDYTNDNIIWNYWYKQMGIINI